MRIWGLLLFIFTGNAPAADTLASLTGSAGDPVRGRAIVADRQVAQRIGLAKPEQVDQPIAGVAMETYIDWMATSYAISCTGLPAISVPCGFSADGLPVGLQMVGRRHRDADVLALAWAFEQAMPLARRRPPVACN